MNAGRGELPALVADLAAGRLTGGAPRAYVVLLQEAVDMDGDPAPTLGRVAAFRLASFFSPVREFDGRVRGNAILASIPLTDPHVIPLPRERQPRAAVVGAVSAGGEALFVVSAHLENRVSWLRGGLFSDGARARQATALIRALPPAAHGVVGGDMNTWLGPTEPAWKTLLTRFPDTPMPSVPEATFRKRLALDHLFFDLPENWRVSRRVLSNAYGSDHHPVLGELFFAP